MDNITNTNIISLLHIAILTPNVAWYAFRSSYLPAFCCQFCLYVNNHVNPLAIINYIHIIISYPLVELDYLQVINTDMTVWWMICWLLLDRDQVSIWTSAIFCNTKTSQKGFSKYWEFSKVKFIFEYFIWITRNFDNGS